MLKYMVDTNIVIYTMKNRPDSVRERFKKHHGRMCISSIILMGLVYGAERSSNPDINLTSLEGFVARMEVLPLNDSAAAHAGQICADLERLGMTIGPYVQFIAGHARSQGLVLVTNNEKEFARVPGLRTENWIL